MSARQLLRVVYTFATEGKDEDQRDQFDALLSGDDSHIRRKRRSQFKAAAMSFTEGAPG